MTALLWIVLVAPYAVFAVARVHAWIKRRRSERERAKRDAERRARLPVTDGPGIVHRNFSIYANALKIGTHQSSTFHLGVDATTLTVNQIVPAETEVPGSALFRNAFLADEKVEIVIGEIDGTMLQFGAMSVTGLDYSTDCKTGVTRLTAQLVGPSLRQPKQVDDPIVVQRAFVYPAKLGPIADALNIESEVARPRSVYEFIDAKLAEAGFTLKPGQAS